MKRLSVLFVSMLLLAGCGEKFYTDINNEQLKALLAEGIEIIDIRRPEEWKKLGVVQGSHKITLFNKRGKPLPDFMTKFKQIVKTKDMPIILICRTGNRTETASEMLSERLGYTQIYNVEDGITHWIKKGNPVVGKGR